MSQATVLEREGALRNFDGTMRVGFSLHKPEVAQAASDSDQEDQDCDPEGEELGSRKRSRFDVFAGTGLKLQWLGGYWKLPIAEMEDPAAELRDRVVSISKQGTALVHLHQLYDVYASLGDMVPLLFESPDLSVRGLISRYATSFYPELGSFLVGVWGSQCETGTAGSRC